MSILGIHDIHANSVASAVRLVVFQLELRKCGNISEKCRELVIKTKMKHLKKLVRDLNEASGKWTRTRSQHEIASWASVIIR